MARLARVQRMLAAGGVVVLSVTAALVTPGVANAASLTFTNCVGTAGEFGWGVTVTGSGFAANGSVTLTAIDRDLEGTPLNTLTQIVPVSGSGAVLIAVGAAGTFPVTITLVDQAGNTASTTLTSCNGIPTGALLPIIKDDCKKRSWELFGFRNQGQCVKAFEEAMHGK